MQNNILINIQFLRAVAAIMVVLFHTTTHYYKVGGEKFGNIFSILEQFGYIGVDIFFVISGYIIWLTTRKISGTKGILDFIYNRTTRIYLAYWIFFIPVLMVYSYFGKDITRMDILGSFFLTSTAIDELLIPVSWTLSYELYFYALFVFLLSLPKKNTIYFLSILFILILMIQTWAYFYLNIYDKEIFHTASTFFTFFMSPYTLEFIVGTFIANYLEKNRIKNLKIIFILGLIFFITGIIYQNNYLHDSLSLGYYIPQRVFFFGTMSALFLATVVEMNKRNILIFPKFSLMVGDASYSLYLSHTILLFFFKVSISTAIKDFGSNLSLLMLLLVFLITIYSIFHYQLVEAPLMKVTRNLKDKITMKSQK